jgi:hemoglobin
MAAETHDTMYRTVGGSRGIVKIVDLFYEKLWADPELQPYFAGIDRDRLKHHQRQFLTFALGGGTLAYEGRSLGDSHADLKITDEAFSKVKWYLQVTLEELDVDRPLIMIINGFVEGGRGQVVTA